MDQIQLIGEKNGSKWLALVDQNGIPLSIVIEGANRHDSRLLDGALEVRVKPPEQTEFNLCLDAGFVGLQMARALVNDTDFVNVMVLFPTSGEEARKSESWKRIQSFELNAGSWKPSTLG